MILKQLQLINFQGYENEIIDLHPHFNCFVGGGHAGKSSIIRALSFLLYGIWNSKWVKWGKDYAEVTLITTDGTVLRRSKGEKINKYVLQRPGQPSQIYENFGKSTPEEIEAITRVFKAQVSGREDLLLNLASQHDPLFLLSQPGSFKAKVLGKLSGGHFLDYALKEINKEKKNLAGEKKLKEIEVVEAEKQLIRYTGLEEKKKKLEEIGIRISRAEQRMRHLENLKKLNIRVQAWKQDYLKEIAEEKSLATFSAAATSALFEQIKNYKSLSNVHHRLVDLEVEATKINKEIIYLTDGVNIVVEKYSSLLKEHQKCPTCFADINETQLNTIKHNL